MEKSSPTIYDEHRDVIYPTASRAATKATERIEYPVLPQKRRVWSTPLVSRDKLTDTLNILEKENYEIFSILSITVSQVQIVCYQEVSVDG